MPEDVDNALTGSWLAARLGIDPRLLDVRRRSGELLAYRPSGSDEWRYPAWQFDEDMRVRPSVQRALEAATAAGIGGTRLHELLQRRVGLTDRRRLVDVLLAGDVDRVVAELRSA